MLGAAETGEISVMMRIDRENAPMSDNEAELRLVAAESEQMTQRLEAQCHRLDVEAYGHLRFQQIVLNDLATVTRMIRDLARLVRSAEMRGS